MTSLHLLNSLMNMQTVHICLSTVQAILKMDVDIVDNISKFEEKTTHTRLS